ncbi:hypothetical protein M9Y10_044968 [Tritrichomonas musculus]|uniref:Uncharacterized protein n=1 Tax=Tritrichomonas musculus TaxID=1915356 RepID=A0ABR2JTX3_9EUKA
MIGKKKFSLIKTFKKQTTEDPSIDELDNELKDYIQNTILQFQECSNEENFEFLPTPISMLKDMLDNNYENNDIIYQILSNFECFFPLFFSLITNLQLDNDIYEILIPIISDITCYIEYPKYSSYATNQFIQALSGIFEYDIEKTNIIKIMSNIFTEANQDIQNFIISQISTIANELPEEEELCNYIIRFFYITTRYIHQLEPYHYQFIMKFLTSFIRFNNLFWFYSIEALIERGFDVDQFMIPEFILKYNQSLYSSSYKILKSVFYLLGSIINKSNYDNLSQLFDYKQAIKVIFQKYEKMDKKENKVILSGIDFLVSSAASGPEMQRYLLSLDILPKIEQLFNSSSFKIRSDLSYLYVNLIPQNNYEMRIQLLKNPFFNSSFLQLIESYKENIQAKILNIVYTTLLKGESLNDKSYHLFLIKSDFQSLVQDLSIDSEKINFKIDKILELLDKTE